jgi:hypothetical protein
LDVNGAGSVCQSALAQLLDATDDAIQLVSGCLTSAAEACQVPVEEPPAPPPTVNLSLQDMLEEVDETGQEAAEQATCRQAAARFAATRDPAETVSFNYTCSESVVNFTVTSALGDASDVVYKILPGTEDTGEPVLEHVYDVTTLQPEVDDAVSEAELGTLGGPRVDPDHRRVASEYHGYTLKRLFYGQYTCVNGDCRTEFESYIRLVHYLSLGQKYEQYYRVKWKEMNNREITFRIPVRMRHVDGWGADETDDSIVFGPESYYNTQDPDYYNTYLDTPKTGKYFAEIYNYKIRDRQHGDFTAVTTSQTPRFKCYKSTTCKFPRGKEA